MSIDYWFPTVVYTEVLKPPPKRERIMLEYVDNFHSEHPDQYTVEHVGNSNLSSLKHRFSSLSWCHSNLPSL